MRCNTCGANVPDGALFCTACGAKAPAAVQQPRASVPYPGRSAGTPCPNCGKTVPEGNAFCTSCGTMLGGAAPSVSGPTTVCWSCRNVVPEGMRFCPACGADMYDVPSPGRGGGYSGGAGGSGGKSSNTPWIVLVFVLVGIIAALAVAFFTGALDGVLGVEKKDDPEPAAATESVATPAPATEQPVAEVTPTPDTSGDYILPDSSTRYLTYADLDALSWRDLCLARNEIFARHGRIFRTPEIAAYFGSKSWYSGRYSEVTLTALETSNVNFSLAYENSHYGGSYY